METNDNAKPVSAPPGKRRKNRLPRMHQINFMVPLGLLARLRAAALKRNVTTSNFMRDVLTVATDKVLGRRRSSDEQLPLTGTDGNR